MIRYAITDGSGRPEGVDTTVDIIQIREPQLTARQLAAASRDLLKRTKAQVLLNDRADVAIAARAHGVHLKSGWARVDLFRSIAPAGFLVSVACHSPDDVRRAADEGADYAVLAPIFSPRSKPDQSASLGPGAVREAAGLGVPLIALGGINEENAKLCVDAGAAGVAGITLFQRRLIVESPDALQDVAGKDLGVTEWVTITQDRITRFADATGDCQWIHVDAERARMESPYGATIAHGFLTVSLLTRFITETIEVRGLRMAVNYGLNRVRFPSAVRSESRVRGRVIVQSVKGFAEGSEATYLVTVENEGSQKPCCVAEWIVRYYR